MAQFLVRRSDHTRLTIERIEAEDLVVEFPMVTREVGRVEGLGPVIEETGEVNTRHIRIRRHMRYEDGRSYSIAFVASGHVAKIADYVRRPSELDMERVADLDAKVAAAEAALGRARRMRREAIENAFRFGKMVSRDELAQAASNGTGLK